MPYGLAFRNNDILLRQSPVESDLFVDGAAQKQFGPLQVLLPPGDTHAVTLTKNRIAEYQNRLRSPFAQHSGNHHRGNVLEEDVPDRLVEKIGIGHLNT